jgi:cytochrome c553
MVGRRFILAVLLLCGVAWGDSSFQEVKAILVENCVKCHGGEKTKGEFDLTSREGLLHPGSEGTNVVAGKAGESRLMKLIRHADEPHMPQKSEKLSEEQIGKIAKWIDAGAPYDAPLIAKEAKPKGHAVVTEEDRNWWAFRPIQEHGRDARGTTIDSFVLEKLKEKGLEMNPVAEKRKLIRRATLDLTGVQPTPEEINSFLNDQSADAWGKVVDRLLASPRYGERWARHWLDLARFAESHGYEQDYDRPAAYHYRDFLIRALNEDMPFDRFVKLQIAGDEIEPQNPEALKATGFLGAGTHATQITANQVEKERYDELDDMGATVGTALLGMTVGCARCHDHKFDPIPQNDYYRFIATFTTTVRSEMDVDLRPEKYAAAKAAFDQEHAPLVEAVKKFEKEELTGRMAAWVKSGAELPRPRWYVIDAKEAKAKSGAVLTRLDDGSYLASGASATHDVYTFTVQTPLAGIAAVKLEALADPSMVKGGPGRAANGNFALSDFSVSANGTQVKIASAKADFEQKGLPIAAAIDADKTSAWAIDPQFGKDHAAVFRLEKPVDGTSLTITLRFENNDKHAIGRVRLSISTDAAADLSGDSGPAVLAEISDLVKTPVEQRSDEQKVKLVAAYRAIDPEWKKLNAAVLAHAKQEPRRELTKVMVCSEGVPAIRLHTQGADFFQKSYFLKRGDPNQKNGEAQAGFLQVLSRAPDGEAHWRIPAPAGSKLSYRRTGLANWITDKQYGAGHLLARVMVNRLWQHHMGRGIVATPNDFGAQGMRPTHPELLDYLASELIANGWKLKSLHRQIMTSAAYMQSSDFNEKAFAADSENTLLWRHPKMRLEAEAIRDSMLIVSGMLDESMYGPGTLDESMKRRSIYFFVKRSKLMPLMVLFDAPEPLSSMGNRVSTTIAPQALALMNNPQVRQWAGGFANRLKGKTAEDAVKSGYEIALGRPPSAEEIKESVKFLEEQRQTYGGPNASDLALEDFCQSLLCLNEFVYVE